MRSSISVSSACCPDISLKSTTKSSSDICSRRSQLTGEKCHKLEIIASIIKQEQRETLVQNIELAFILRSNRDIKALAALEVSMRLVQWTTIFRPSSVRFSH